MKKILKLLLIIFLPIALILLWDQYKNGGCCCKLGKKGKKNKSKKL